MVAVLTIERKPDRPLTLDEMETLRLTCDLFTARLTDLYEHDRWLGAKLAKSSERGLAWFVGAKHTWPKVAAIAVAGLIAFSVFVKGDYKVESTFSLDSSEKQVVPAPFDGFLKTVSANIGDLVWTDATAAPFNDLAGMSPLVPTLIKRPSSILATLNTAELRTSRDEAQANMLGSRQAASNARSLGISKEGEVKINEDDELKYKAQYDLYDWRIQQATIKAPIDGIVFSGDLKTKLGAPVRTGDELFQVGERSKLRAKLSVPEDQIAELMVNQHGELAASTYPGIHIPFTVERINPIATIVDQHNVYEVRAVFDAEDIKPWMRPGIEGVAKVERRSARYTSALVASPGQLGPYEALDVDLGAFWGLPQYPSLTFNVNSRDFG